VTTSAFPFLEKVGKKGNELVPTEFVFAVLTMRPAFDNVLSFGQPVSQNVEKRSNKKPKKKYDKNSHYIQHTGKEQIESNRK